MNEDDNTALKDLIASLKGKPTDELRAYLTMTSVINFACHLIGISVILASMYVPTMIMFIVTGIIVWMAGNVATVTGALKPMIREQLSTRDEDD